MTKPKTQHQTGNNISTTAKPQQQIQKYNNQKHNQIKNRNQNGKYTTA